MIKAFPLLDIRRGFARRLADDPLLARPGLSYYSSARAALFHAVRALELPERSVVLLPAFHCGVEVEAVLRASCRVAFYRVRRDLSIDLEDLYARMHGETAAVVVIHYFGFPQELTGVQELCGRSGAVLIEDCAHALYSRDSSGRFLGTMGAYGLFSLQKTVALPNGGALLVNGAGKPALQGRKYFELSLLKSLLRSSLEYEASGGGALGALATAILGAHRSVSGGIGSGAGDDAAEGTDLRWYYDVARYGYDCDISALSLPFVGKERADDIVSLRRRNYQLLESLLDRAGLRDLVLSRLPEGVCPLCLPVVVENRDEVVDRMQGRGVEPFVFGRFAHQLLDHDLFPEARFLAGSIIGLPIQQQLVPEHLQTVADVFRHALDR